MTRCLFAMLEQLESFSPPPRVAAAWHASMVARGQPEAALVVRGAKLTAAMEILLLEGKRAADRSSLGKAAKEPLDKALKEPLSEPLKEPSKEPLSEPLKEPLKEPLSVALARLPSDKELLELGAVELAAAVEALVALLDDESLSAMQEQPDSDAWLQVHCIPALLAFLSTCRYLFL